MVLHGGSDRLSTLPVNALEAILSHLESDEASRASALSRRWRRAYAAVPVVDLVDGKVRPRPGRRGKPVCFDTQVTSAIMSKNPATPIRVFRIHALHPPYDLLDQWIVIAAASSAEDVDVNLHYGHYSNRRLCPFGGFENASADFGHDVRGGYILTPRQLFRCVTLRRLRLTNWTLDLPRGSIVVASLETLCLRRIMAADGALQQLLSSCPNLADLTLEECPSATEVTVTSAHLRSFAMVCCHNARRVVLQTRRLRSLRYKGGLPRESSFISIADYGEVTVVTIDICEDLTGKDKKKAAPLTELIGQCTKLTYLYLSLRPSMAQFSSEITAVARSLRHLKQLVLNGFLAAEHVVKSVAVLLANTKNLEALTLFPQGPAATPQKKKTYYYSDDDDDNDDESDTEVEAGMNCVDDRLDYSSLTKSLWRMSIPCLGRSLRSITIAKYTGHALDRILAQFLLSKATALQDFSVTLSAQLWPRKEEIAREFRSWRFNRRTTITFN